LILVFGGHGQLGRALARQSTLRGIELLALSRSEGDITDPGAVENAIARWRPDVVVNAAAYTKVDLAESNLEQARLGNEIGPALLANACNRAGIPLIHMSTDYVFDGRKTGAYLETDPICPINAYGRSKAAGEEAVRGALDRHLILRTAWLYSEIGENFFNTMLRLAATRDELRIVADQHGSPTSAHAIAAAILQIAPSLARIGVTYGTYHVTASGATTWHGFASRIVALSAAKTGRNPVVTPIRTVDFPTAAKRPFNSVLANQKFAQVFGIRMRDWADELPAVIASAFSAGLPVSRHVA
jgi:dTDP-4-dehydrorhamnose reductase